MIARALAAAVLVAGGLLALAAARSHPDLSSTAGSGWAQAAMLAAGWLVAVAGVAGTAQRDRLVTVLLLAVGASWFAGELDSPATGSPALFTLALLAGAAAPAIVAHLALTIARPGAWAPTAAVAYAVGLGLQGIVSAITFDELAAGCAQCPPNLVSVVSNPELHADVERLGVRLAVVVYAAAALLLVVAAATATPSRRRSWAPVVVPAAAYVALAAAANAHAWSRGFVSNDETDQALWLAQAAALVAIAAGVGWQRLATRRTRAALARIVIDVAASSMGAGLRDRLADMLGDERLEIVYRADPGGWIDRDGNAASAQPSDGMAVTSLVHDGAVAAAVLHRAGLLDDPRLVGELQRAARLAIDHERLRARLGAELAYLRESRARIVALTTAERRRLERDIHDGAQQGLVRLAMELAFAAASADDPAPFADARREVLDALDALRQLAHGIFPSMLHDRGIAAAIGSLAEWDPRVSVGPLPRERFSTTTETVAYFCVAIATRASEQLSVSGGVRDGRLLLDLQVSGLARDAAVELADRVAAIDGRIERRDDGSSAAHLLVELPCG